MSMRAITATSTFDALAQHLEIQARALAAARLEARHLARKGDESRWRRADLLWPDTVKG